MKIFLRSITQSIILYFFIAPNISNAQVINWQDYPDKTFVYEISNQDAEKIFRGKMTNEDLFKKLDQPTTSFATTWTERPAQGHFMMAMIRKNQVIYDYYTVYPFQVFLFKEYGRLTLQVIDRDGKVRKDAKVKIKGAWFMQNSRVGFDSKTETYSIDDSSKRTERTLTVELDGFVAVFDLNKHIVEPWYGYGGDNGDNKPTFYSYMITDKNKYKPGETVRFKSYALTGDRRPLNSKLSVWMYSQNYTYKKVGDISPYNPGGYAGEVTLHDSLKLRLDSRYPIQLRDKTGRVVANTHFYYEDYELYDNNLTVKIQSSTHFHPEANNLEIHATDANGLTLKDVRAEITIFRSRVGKVYTDRVALADTLMLRKIDLDNEKTTNFSIPASVFGDADGSYMVRVTVITFDNQRMERQFYVNYYRSHFDIRMTTQNDSVRFAFFELGKEREVSAEMSYEGSPDTSLVQLPLVVPFNQNVTGYWLKTTNGDQQKYFYNSQVPTGLDIVGGFAADSLNIRLVNPLGLEMSWYVYQGGMIAKKGYGKEVDLKLPKSDLDVVHYFEAFYRIGTQDFVFSREFTPRKEMLSIEVDFPERVYPGQKIDATISVKDAFGVPVKGADITAMGYNSLLNYYVPDLPYYGDDPKAREEASNYWIDKRGLRFTTQLDFEKWRELASLDSYDYYRFTYPWFTTFRHTVPTIDSITQFAPYVFKDGNAVNIYVIEDNGVPVYFSWTDNLKGYSFPVKDSVKHRITMRLNDMVVALDSMVFVSGRKTILSVDLDHLPLTAKIIKIHSKNSYKQDVFTGKEIQTYSSYVSVIPINDYSNHAYLTQGKTKYQLYHPDLMNARSSVIAGPIPSGKSKYMSNLEYLHEGGFLYKYDTNVVYKYPYTVFPLTLDFSSSNNLGNLNQFFFSEKFLDSTLKNIAQSRNWHPRTILIAQAKYNANFRLPIEVDSSGVNNLIFKNIKTKTTYLANSNNKDNLKRTVIPAGVYDAFLLYNNGKYLRIDTVNLRTNTYMDFNMGVSTLHSADSTSLGWLKINPDSYTTASTPNTPRNVGGYSSYYSTPVGALGNTVKGVVYDDMGEPLIGAYVFVKGTNRGTSTDIDGKFSIDMQDGTTLIFTYIGFKNKEVNISGQSEIRVVMETEEMHLDEVVVTGYGSPKRAGSTVGSSTRVLSGVAYGLTASSDMVKMEKSNAKIFRDDVKEEDSNLAILEEVSAPAAPGNEAEEKLYAELMMLNGLRSNFSDVGFWEPRLYTDKNGKANFSVTFPDNITKWTAVVYAMNRKLQTGTYRAEIKSYKPLMAELRMPQFMVVGDSSYFAGNIRNYTLSKTIAGNIIFAQEQDTLMRKHISFETSHQDKMLVVAPATDSLRATYLFTRDDGYNDGERRVINIVPQGTLVARGTLDFLRNGDKIDVEAADSEEVHVKITGKQIEIYADAANYLRGYEYACNEQLASKLIGLVNYKLYTKYLNEKFKFDKNINEIITRLTRNQNGGKLWSWWGNSSETSLWMSAHVLRALKMAQDNGYPVNLNIQNIEQDYIDLKTIRHSSLNDIEILHALSGWGTRQNYAPAIEQFEKQIRRLEFVRDSTIQANEKAKKLGKPAPYFYPKSYLKEKLMLWEIRQSQGLGYVSDSISRYLKKDVLGLTYCDDGMPNSRPWYCDNLQTTLIAYRIIKRDSTLVHHKEAIQMYVLGTKHYGWNTYQASSALATIMPDLLSESTSKNNPATVILRGKEHMTLTQPSYETILKPGEKLNIEKVDGMPLIYTAYTIKRVTGANSGEAFEVSTKLSVGDTITAGEPMTMTVTVLVKQKNAEHIMIEIPIPAGCSYASKPNYFWRSGEVHREYFKEKTVIFCEQLPEGKHEFTINLLPRYTGLYILNPAKVEMMYFPTINANNDLRKVEVAERTAPEDH